LRTKQLGNPSLARVLRTTALTATAALALSSVVALRSAQTNTCVSTTVLVFAAIPATETKDGPRDANRSLPAAVIGGVITLVAITAVIANGFRKGARKK
jgi:hypothetical protein